MKVIPDASDVLRKNMQMLQNIRTLVPQHTENKAQDCVNSIKTFLKLTITGKWGTLGKLEDSIDRETLQTGQKTIIGIANTKKMPKYWRIQEYGGNIPARVPRFAKAMHYFAYGEEWYLKHVEGFVIAAKNYLTNGFSFATNRAKVSFTALMNTIMPK